MFDDMVNAVDIKSDYFDITHTQVSCCAIMRQRDELRRSMWDSTLIHSIEKDWSKVKTKKKQKERTH